MKTALTELIEELGQKRDMWKADGSATERRIRGAYVDAIGMAKNLLKEEMMQIQCSWIDGKETEGFGNNVFNDAEFYYHKKYIESEM